MKFIVDAQLPRRITRWLTDAGHDAVHTLDLPRQNRTSDRDITALAGLEGRIVISKDDDFVISQRLNGSPGKLLLLSTGNISNVQLEAVFQPHIAAIIAAFETADFVELTRTALIIHF